jgi:hypothetical protein
MINVNAKKDWHDIIYLYLQENMHMYCSGSGFPGERFRLLGASSFRTPLEPPFKKFLDPRLDNS